MPCALFRELRLESEPTIYQPAYSVLRHIYTKKSSAIRASAHNPARNGLPVSVHVSADS